MLRNSLFALVLSLSLLFGSSLQAESLKVAIVDLNMAMAKSKDGQKSAKILEEKMKSQREVLKNKEKTLIQKSRELQDSLMMSPETKAKKQDELMKLQQELQGDAQKAQQQFSQEQQAQMQRLLVDLKTIVQRIAEKKGLDLVIERQLAQAVLFTKFDAVDITSEVIAEFDKGKP